MLYLENEFIDLLERQLYNKARDIEVALYNSLVTKEFKSMAADALLMYYHDDGGFGEALYIDNYNPNSNAYTTYYALKLIYEYDLANFPIIKKILKKVFNYLFKKAYKNNYFFFKAEPSNTYPCSNDFKYDKSYTLCPTLGIIGYALLLGDDLAKKDALNLLNLIKDRICDDLIKTGEDILNLSILIKGLKENKLIYSDYKTLLVKYLEPLYFKTNDCLMIEVDTYYNLNQEVKDVLLDEMINCKNKLGFWDYDKPWHNEYPEGDVALLKWVGATSLKYFYYLKKNLRIK